MGKKRSTPKNKNTLARKPSMVWLSILLVTVSFIGGTIFSSFRLAGDAAPMSQSTGVSRAADLDALKAGALKNKDNAKAWTQLGNAYFDSDQYQNAIEAYEKSVAIEPGNPNVLTDLGVMYRRNKQPEKAVEMFNRAIEADSKHEFSRMNKGVVLFHDLNDKQGAMKAWEGLLAVNPIAMFGNGQSVDSVVWKYKQKGQK